MFYDMGAISTTATIVGKSIKVHCVYICVVHLNSNRVSKCMCVCTYRSFMCSLPYVYSMCGCKSIAVLCV